MYEVGKDYWILKGRYVHPGLANAERAHHKRCNCTNTLGKPRISTHGSRDNIIHLQRIPDGYGSKRIDWIN
jgi:hypothetical protein